MCVCVCVCVCVCCLWCNASVPLQRQLSSFLVERLAAVSRETTMSQDNNVPQPCPLIIKRIVLAALTIGGDDPLTPGTSGGRNSDRPETEGCVCCCCRLCGAFGCNASVPLQRQLSSFLVVRHLLRFPSWILDEMSYRHWCSCILPGCVCERERDRDRETERDRDRERERET